MLDILAMNNNIDLNLLIVFDAVWRHRRILRAAAELNASQPTVSNALRRSHLPAIRPAGISRAPKMMA